VIREFPAAALRPAHPACHQPVSDRWGILSAERQRSGAPLNTADGLIAATALEHDLTLVTRNVKDFAGLGVTLFNPWELL